MANSPSTRTRGEMLDGLMRDDRLIGMTREQLVALLGRPTRTDKFREWDLVYVTGPVGWDYEWLLLRLNDGVRIAGQAIRGD